MGKLAWRILALFMGETHRLYGDEYGRGYIAAWHLSQALGLDASTVQATTTKHGPRNEYERALRELLDLGIVEEVSNLGERFQLVVKELSE